MHKSLDANHVKKYYVGHANYHIYAQFAKDVFAQPVSNLNI
jgi:hypothetical protein